MYLYVLDFAIEYFLVLYRILSINVWSNSKDVEILIYNNIILLETCAFDENKHSSCVHWGSKNAGNKLL